MFFAPGCRRVAGNFSEMPSEIAFVRESYQFANFQDGHVGIVQQQLPGFVDTKSVYPLVECFILLRIDEIRKIRAVCTERNSHVFHRKISLQVFLLYFPFAYCFIQLRMSSVYRIIFNFFLAFIFV